jgi:hypothetical protein
VKISGLQSIPILRQNRAEIVPASTNRCVVDHGNLFTLYRPGYPPEDLILPRYHDHSGILLRTALTPVAVACDLACVGVALGIAGAIGYFWHGPNSY